MSKHRRIRYKDIVLVCIAIICVLLVIGLIFLFRIFPPSISENRMMRDFTKDRNEIQLITNYLIELPYAGLYDSNSYTHERGEIQITSNETGDELLIIDDPQVVNAIEYLLNKRGYDVIHKGENYVLFQRWSSLDAGRGVAYSRDGEIPHIDFLVYAKIIEGNNWYYYESDFNKWEIENSSN